MEKIDEIRKQIEFDAPIARVWDAITKAEEVSQWFGDITDIELIPGGKARFGWSDHDAVYEAVVTEVDEPYRFSYSWAHFANKPYDAELAHHVEITLEDVDGRTRLTLIESGFARLPDDLYGQALAGNDHGWDSELTELGGYLATVVAS